MFTQGHVYITANKHVYLHVSPSLFIINQSNKPSTVDLIKVNYQCDLL